MKIREIWLFLCCFGISTAYASTDQPFYETVDPVALLEESIAQLSCLDISKLVGADGGIYIIPEKGGRVRLVSRLDFCSFYWQMYQYAIKKIITLGGGVNWQLLLGPVEINHLYAINVAMDLVKKNLARQAAHDIHGLIEKIEVKRDRYSRTVSLEPTKTVLLEECDKMLNYFKKKAEEGFPPIEESSDVSTEVSFSALNKSFFDDDGDDDGEELLSDLDGYDLPEVSSDSGFFI